jgi:hypothetical protein
MVIFKDGSTRIGVSDANGVVRTSNKYGEFVVDLPKGATVQYQKDSNNVKHESSTSGSAVKGVFTGVPSNYVSLREWEVQWNDIDYYLHCELNWNADTHTVAVTMGRKEVGIAYNPRAITEYSKYDLTAYFMEGVHGKIIDGRMYVGEELLWGVFGTTIDPPLDVTTTEDAIKAGIALGVAIKLGGYIITPGTTAMAQGTGKTVDLYRAVGVREYESIVKNKAFLSGANSLEGRQFAFTEAEALKYAATDPSKIAIIKTTISEKLLSNFDYSKTIDPNIFKNGVVTIQPETNALFNESIISIEILP